MTIGYNSKIAYADHFDYLWECEDIEVLIGTPDDYESSDEYEARLAEVTLDPGSSPDGLARVYDTFREMAQDGYADATDWIGMLDRALDHLREELKRDDYIVWDRYNPTMGSGGYHDADDIIEHFDLDNGNVYWELEPSYMYGHILRIWEEDETLSPEEFVIESGIIIEDDRRWKKPVVMDEAATVQTARLLAHEGNEL